ncbi:T9SS type A sorting domain-containing protein [Pontimicrobium sp. IMCC45349]|uniref:T9SS type A sorting domain-containing protein n=1 Tax=Pontimicrobium sp. IMCC45349 TaxID=3391574 RepID=UPI0039A15096
MKKITLLIALFAIFNVNAQWTTDTAANTLVASSNSSDMMSIGTSDGQTYVVFWKEVAAPVNYELRVQLMDASGNQQFGADGMLISNTIPMSSYTLFWSVSIDTNDNLYVGVTGTGDETGFAYKVDTSGNILWTISNPDAYLVKVLPLSSGDVIVSWLSVSTYSATMRKYDSNGNAVWPSEQSVASPSPSSPANLYEISSGNLIMVFHELGSGVSSTLYAQRFDTDGNEVWSNPTQLSNKTTAYNSFYSGAQDNDVIYYGYSAATATRFDSFVQRINPDGTLPWGINGADFDTNETNFEKGTKIAFASGSNYVWAICTYSDTSQNNIGEYVQKFDKVTGARQLTETAKEVYAIGTDNVHAGDLRLIDDQPLFIIKSGADNGATPTALNACYLDANGDFVWPEETKPIATYSANKGDIHFNMPVNGDVVTAFVEDRGAGDNMYVQRFTDASLSVEEFNLTNTLEYQNPIKDELKIKSNELINEVQVYSAIGQQLGIYKMNSNNITINSQDWSSGLYIVKVITQNGKGESFKILKK